MDPEICSDFDDSSSFSDKEIHDSDSNEDFDEDDDSDGLNTQAFLDHLDLKFRELLDKKVAETERLYDHGLILCVAGINVAIQTDPIDDQFSSDSGVVFQPKVAIGKNVEIQTDDASISGLLVSMQLEGREQPEIARSEIANLRDDRMVLVNQRKELADRIKNAAPEESMKGEEKRLYKLEETIEAIDTVIEYKNEIICGQQFVLSSDAPTGKDESDLITRLTSLSLLEQQRLMCKYFSKVVELRYSSRKLEKALEKLEEDIEKMRRRLSMDHKFMREKDAENEARIKHLLSQCNKDPHLAVESHFKTLEKALSSTRRKQYDLERSLTELLVRHGYLLNGADYDVKQVVKMLGIDTMQMGLNWRDGEAEEKRRREKILSPQRGVIPSSLAFKLESGSSGQGVSRRMKEAIGQRQLDRRNAQTSSSHHFMPFEKHVTRNGHHGHHGHHHHSSRQPEPPSEPFPGTEVRRQKKKLIIQPPQPSTSH